MEQTPTTAHARIASQFYDGMIQATLEARNQVVPRLLEQFEKRELLDAAQKAFNTPLIFRKRLLTDAPDGPTIEHTISRFSVEYFSCISALNLYRLLQHEEKFKAELMRDAFFEHSAKEEPEWLGLYGANAVDLQTDTGHAAGQLRNDIVRFYLNDLLQKSSLDADTLIAIRRFFDRQRLSKNFDVPVTPAMHEACAEIIAPSANWLSNFLKYHPF